MKNFIIRVFNPSIKNELSPEENRIRAEAFDKLWGAQY